MVKSRRYCAHCNGRLPADSEDCDYCDTEKRNDPENLNSFADCERFDKEKELKTYIGDRAYARFDGYYVWLFTHDGYQTTNQVEILRLSFDSYKENLNKEKG